MEWATDATILPGSNRRAGPPATVPALLSVAGLRSHTLLAAPFILFPLSSTSVSVSLRLQPSIHLIRISNSNPIPPDDRPCSNQQPIFSQMFCLLFSTGCALKHRAQLRLKTLWTIFCRDIHLRHFRELTLSLQGIQTIIAGNEVFGIDYLLTRLASNRAQKLIYNDHNMQLSFPAQILSIPFLWKQFPNLKQVVVRIR